MHGAAAQPDHWALSEGALALLQGAVSLWLQKLPSRSALLNTYCVQFAVQCAWSKEEGATRPGARGVLSREWGWTTQGFLRKWEHVWCRVRGPEGLGSWGREQWEAREGPWSWQGASQILPASVFPSGEWDQRPVTF